MTSPRPLTIGIDPALLEWRQEITYTLRTLLRVAGLPYRLCTPEAGHEQRFDLYYGCQRPGVSASVVIPACGLSYGEIQNLEPARQYQSAGLTYLFFVEAEQPSVPLVGGNQRFEHDIVFASFWLLVGAREPTYGRGRLDNLHLEGSFFLQNSLQTIPLVSLYGDWLRKHFSRLGFQPLDLPWVGKSEGAAFVLTHDVDYPQIIRGIEVLRLMRDRGVRGIRSAYDVLRGSNHFWKFSEWVDLAAEYGAAPTFYFMARRGSLWQYAAGTPDCFYDIASDEFRQLFDDLRQHGCEIGLHASYHAHSRPDQIRLEKEKLEAIAGVSVAGNRHHYWHLDPLAPHETLALAERAGLAYDTSLAFEFYPGFRRGTCHPFRPFHVGERRELELVELPPTWMDDHFDRRRVVNQIDSPDRAATELVETARSTGGVVVVDYHVRGMNENFFPRYGKWLRGFLRDRLDDSVRFLTAQALAEMYAGYEEQLESLSSNEL